jgi:hypothetical protein
MNDHEQSTSLILAQIDRLVSADLPEPDRRSLLAWLDEEPARWRACALAFLEAQTWEQAAACPEEPRVRGATREGEAPANPWVQGSGFGVQKDGGNAKTAWVHWLAIAGMLVVAFAAGAAIGVRWIPDRTAPPQFAQPGSTSPARSPGPLLATVSVRTNLDPRLQTQLTLPVEPADAPLATVSSISEYDRKQWERRGYELVEETRYLPAKMPDGRTVMVPVNRVQLKFKGIPVS